MYTKYMTRLCKNSLTFNTLWITNLIFFFFHWFFHFIWSSFFSHFLFLLLLLCHGLYIDQWKRLLNCNMFHQNIWQNIWPSEEFDISHVYARNIWSQLINISELGQCTVLFVWRVQSHAHMSAHVQTQLRVLFVARVKSHIQPKTHGHTLVVRA